jgi:hypothetical protein
MTEDHRPKKDLVEVLRGLIGQGPCPKTGTKPSERATWRGKTFYNAIADFSKAYHQQTVSDHEVMLEAIRSGKIETHDHL